MYKGYIRDITPYTRTGLAQSDKGSLPLHFTPYALATIRERQRATFALANFVSDSEPLT